MFNRTIKRIGRRYDISVIVPFHNVERYISQCLDSLIAQKGPTIEIILINDGSTDESENIVKRYTKENDNIRMHITNNNGPGYARNLGVKKAKGEYIAFLDADDILVKGIYRRMIRAARNNNADVCICNAARFNKKTVWSSDLHNRVYKNYQVLTDINETPELIYDTCCWNKLIRKDFYKRERLQFPEHVVYEDISFNAYLHQKCNKVVMLAETGYLWRVRDDNDNRSLTQLHYLGKNISDRFLAAAWIADSIISNQTNETLKTEAAYKLLQIDLKVILDSVKRTTESEAKILFKKVSDFIDNNIPPEVMDKLPIVDVQRYKLVRNGDVDGYKELITYRWEHYNNAAVEEKGSILYAILPEDIITVEKRSLNDEFSRMQRRTWVDEIRVVNGEIEIDAHLYIQRYNMQSPEDQIIKIFLVNEETNRQIEVEAEKKETRFLTENYGTVHDETTGITSHYNYDYTGFKFRIGKNVSKIETGLDRTKFSVVVEYKDRLFSGTQIISGVSGQIKNSLSDFVLEESEKRIYPSFGAQNELQIVVKRILE